MTIDEVIEDLKEFDIWHVIEWLEELKELRETTFNYTKMLDDRYEQGKAYGINKFVVNAITEFQKFDKEHGYPTLGDISVILSDVAEQLKEQKNDD